MRGLQLLRPEPVAAAGTTRLSSRNRARHWRTRAGAAPAASTGPEDDALDALEDTFRQLFYSLEDVRECSAEYKMIVRQLTGLREGSEFWRLIFEEFSMRGYEIP